MAYARQADQALPQSTIFPVAAIIAVIAAALVAGILAVSALDLFGSPRPSAEFPNPALVEAEARWELHRKLQSGTVDAQTQADREWERQRAEQSPFD